MNETSFGRSGEDAGRRLEVAEQLLEVAAAIGRERGVDEILDALYESFADILPFDRLEYARIDEGGREMVTAWVRAEYEPLLLDRGFVYARDDDSPPFGREGVPFIQYALEEQDLVARPPGHPLRMLREEGITSAICCPLVDRDRVFGYLFFCSRRHDAYDDFHMWVMTRMANVAAGVIATGELRDELADRNRELEQLAAFRSRYVATIGHELRTPLTAVVGFAATLRDEHATMDADETAALVGMLAEQADETVAIVDDLLTIARAEAGELEVRRGPVDLRAEADAVVSVLGDGLRVEGTAAVLGDPKRVRQILRNLVTNAARHGGPHVSISIAVDGGMGVVEVVDDGPGLDAASLDRLFEPYARSGTHEQSIGLGLWVSRELAGRMGGSLEYERRDDRTVFRLTLPTAP